MVCSKHQLVAIRIYAGGAYWRAFGHIKGKLVAFQFRLVHNIIIYWSCASTRHFRETHPNDSFEINGLNKAPMHTQRRCYSPCISQPERILK